MSKYNVRIFICSILSVFVILFMIVSTYAYFNNGKKDSDNLNNNIEVTYDGTSNLTLVNAKSDETLTKTWRVKNLTTSTLYLNISLKDIINNFNENGLVYSLYSENKVDIQSANISNDNSLIASNVELNSNETIDFKLTIQVLDNNKENNTFSSSIDIDVLSESNAAIKDSLFYKIITNNEAVSDKDLVYDDISSEGLFWTNKTTDGGRVYFFRGSNNLNNNVKMGDMCFKIIRTNEDNTVKLIYNGQFNNQECDGTNNIVSVSSFNNSSNYNAYVGYVYGSPNSNNYESEHKNINSSTIKTIVNDFYEKKLLNYSKIITDSSYCSNRKVASFTYNSVKYDTFGFKNYNSGYESMQNFINSKPNYKCVLVNDNLKSANLSYPVGLITMDEVMFAGLNGKIDNKNNYLYSKDGYWTMTPAYYDGINAYNFAVSNNGRIIDTKVNTEYGVRPVITIKNDAIVISGSGTSIDPYILD